MRLKGKVAVINGAASGIGRASALLFASAGNPPAIEFFSTISLQLNQTID